MAFAQESIYGKIYGDNAIAKYIKVSNTIKNTTTFSDENGNFSLKATVGDSIMFSSSFYEKKKIIINTTHFSKVLVVQLKDKINELEEVVLKEVLSEKKFNPRAYNKELNTRINVDVKNKPWEYKYSYMTPRQGVNLKGFMHLKGKLFPKKGKDKKYLVLEPISYNDIKKLNNNDEFFSDRFFTKDLKIPKDFKYIFFEYFDDQEISSKLLSAENRLLLIEKFVELSDKFLNIVNQVKIPDNKTLNDSIKNNNYHKKDFD